jgi:hypothetical protein
VNILIDESDTWSYSGANCTYDGGTSKLTRIRVRRPIAFPVHDRQVMAWRYVVEGTNDADLSTANWTSVVMGPLEKVTAKAKQPAPFTPKTFNFNDSIWANYRVVDRVSWYEGSTVSGRSWMAIESYDRNGNTTTGDFFLGCPSEIL